ncbi:MAG TPA: hypothetical protein VFF74_02920 [Methylophilaceae bacterium]|nr:hypothetical protein [Methylophilaceae bacterium]
MAEYQHHILGIYAARPEAEVTRQRLLQAGMTPDKLNIIAPGDVPIGKDTTPKSGEVLGDVVADAAIGAAAGSGLGALGTVLMAGANVSLFVANPIVGTLAMMGWGASVGGLVGAAAGAGNIQRNFSDLVKDALKSGHTVLIGHTVSDEQTAVAEQIIRESMKEEGGPSA